MARSRAPVTIAVLDCRPLVLAGHSGVGRFTGALASALAAIAHESHGELQVCFVAPQDNLREALHACGARSSVGLPDGSAHGPLICSLGGLLHRLLPKPRALWATYALGFLAFVWRFAAAKQGVGRFIWIAPDNIDRPCILPPWARLGRRRWFVVQVVHDLIPLQFPTQQNRALRVQLHLLLGILTPRWLAVLPVSGLTAEHLRRVWRKPKAARIAEPLGLCLGQSYLAALERVNALGGAELLEEIRRVLPELTEWLSTSGIRFVLGVGRDESYKRWPLAAFLTQQWSRKLQVNPNGPVQELLFIHVCAESAAGDYAKLRLGGSFPLSARAVFYPESGIIRFLNVDDYSLACLYRLAEVFLHWSLLEGFGLPAAEAYVAGCPTKLNPQCGFREAVAAFGDEEELHYCEPDVLSVVGDSAVKPVPSGYGYRVSDDWILQNIPKFHDDWYRGAQVRTSRSRRRMANPLVRDLLGSTRAMAIQLKRLMERL